MTIRVAFNCSRLSLTMAWVRLSRALVASSKYIILGLLTMALAIKSLCLCPPDRLVPPSLTIVYIPMGIS